MKKDSCCHRNFHPQNSREQVMSLVEMKQWSLHLLSRWPCYCLRQHCRYPACTLLPIYPLPFLKNGQQKRARLRLSVKIKLFVIPNGSLPTSKHPQRPVPLVAMPLLFAKCLFLANKLFFHLGWNPCQH